MSGVVHDLSPGSLLPPSVCVCVKSDVILSHAHRASRRASSVNEALSALSAGDAHTELLVLTEIDGASHTNRRRKLHRTGAPYTINFTRIKLLPTTLDAHTKAERYTHRASHAKTTICTHRASSAYMELYTLAGLHTYVLCVHRASPTEVFTQPPHTLSELHARTPVVAATAGKKRFVIYPSSLFLFADITHTRARTNRGCPP